MIDNKGSTGAPSAGHDTSTVVGRKRYLVELLRPHLSAAIATLEDLAVSARSPRIRMAAERDLKRYRARAAAIASRSPTLEATVIPERGDATDTRAMGRKPRAKRKPKENPHGTP